VEQFDPIRIAPIVAANFPAQVHRYEIAFPQWDKRLHSRFDLVGLQVQIPKRRIFYVERSQLRNATGKAFSLSLDHTRGSIDSRVSEVISKRRANDPFDSTRAEEGNVTHCAEKFSWAKINKRLSASFPNALPQFKEFAQPTLTGAKANSAIDETAIVQYGL